MLLRCLLFLNFRSILDMERNTMLITHMAKNRLVITLGVNKSPYWQINYGIGKDVSDETMADVVEPLVIKWYGDSYIKISTLNDKT